MRSGALKGKNKKKNFSEALLSFRKKLQMFFLVNPYLRKIKIFFSQVIKPGLIKISLFLTAFLVVACLVLKFFQPALFSRIVNKSSFYFFHYLNLDNFKFEKINVSGNYRTSREEIVKVIEYSQKKILTNDSQYYQPLIQNLVDDIKSNLPWINKVVITRSIPDSLNIFVTEYQPFAIWHNDGNKYIIDKDGNSVPFEQKYADLEEFRDLIIISGKGANIHAKSLFNILAIDYSLKDDQNKNSIKNIFDDIYSATWIGDRRWDIHLKNGLLIKLPESSISEAWNYFIKMYNSPGSVIGLKTIDLRIKDTVYLEYEDSELKDLKNI